MAQAADWFFALGDAIHEVPQDTSMRELLLRFPEHQYTVTRTLPAAGDDAACFQVIDLPWHCNRLLSGVQPGPAAWNRCTLQCAVAPTLRALSRELRKRAAAAQELVLLLLLVDAEPESECPEPRVMAYAQPMPAWGCLGTAWDELPRRRVGVLLGSGQLRQRPWTKHSAWVAQRRHLERLRTRLDVDELLLTANNTHAEDAGFHILEGLISNFFVVTEQGGIATAPAGDPREPEGVLPGWTRNAILEECRGHQLQVDERAPLSTSVATPDGGLRWREAFLSSAVSLVVPVSQLLLVPLAAAETLLQAVEAIVDEQPGVLRLQLQPDECGSLGPRIREWVVQRFRKSAQCVEGLQEVV